MSIFESSLIILILSVYLIIEIIYGVKSYKGFKRWGDTGFLAALVVFLALFIITVIFLGKAIMLVIY